MSGWSRAASTSPSVASGPLATELSTSTKVSPRIPAVLIRVTESFRRLKEYLVFTFIVTSTGAIGLPLTMRIPVTLPMSTPASRTGAPSRRPAALSKYECMVILLVNHPPVPLMRKIRTMSVMLATRTVSPTRSCDHLSCFWLGKGVRGRHNIIAKSGGFQGLFGGEIRFRESGMPVAWIDNHSCVHQDVGRFWGSGAGVCTPTSTDSNVGGAFEFVETIIDSAENFAGGENRSVVDGHVGSDGFCARQDGAGQGRHWVGWAA